MASRKASRARADCTFPLLTLPGACTSVHCGQGHARPSPRPRTHEGFLHGSEEEGAAQTGQADPLLASVAGWANASVSGTLLATLHDGDDVAALLAACRAIAPADGAEHALSALPGVLVARYLGDHSEAARLWFVALWQVLRPALLGRPAVLPRIWST